MQLCEASGEAHAVGIVHRDLKPRTDVVASRTDPDFVKVLDFGIARINWGEQFRRDRGGAHLTAPRVHLAGSAQATPLAPERLYSIRRSSTRCLAGRTPFEEIRPSGCSSRRSTIRPPHSNRSRRRVRARPLADVIMANLAKDPKRREQDARSPRSRDRRRAKQSGLSPDDISGPMLRRQPTAMQMRPTERTSSTSFRRTS